MVRNGHLVAPLQGKLDYYGDSCTVNASRGHSHQPHDVISMVVTMPHGHRTPVLGVDLEGPDTSVS